MQSNPKEKNNLVKFRLKLTNDEHQLLRLMSATDGKFQYEVLYDALCWARQNSNKILPLAYPSSASFRSCYLESDYADLGDLEQAWKCKTNCALYTAVVLYLRTRRASLEGTLNILPAPQGEVIG
ncbi:hypothetical protein DOK_11676 [gamma proteobacterium BDW918]|nr:hypothetical protein DOK_11676 [gamma proteobacterium BDW918]